MGHPRIHEFQEFLFDEEGEQRPLVEDDCEAFERWREALDAIAHVSIGRAGPRESEAGRLHRARARAPDQTPSARGPRAGRAPPRVTPESLHISPDALRLLDAGSSG